MDPSDFIPKAYRDRAFLRRKEVARISGLSEDYFARQAWAGTGPRYVHLSGPRGRVLYPVREFFEWLNSLGKEDVR